MHPQLVRSLTCRTSPLRLHRFSIQVRLDSTWSTHPSLAATPSLKTSLQSNFGYDQMTPVQKQVLDAVHGSEAAGKRRDMLVRAKTGTGKTLAFLVAAIQLVLKNPVKPTGVSILVFSPTRELAVQTANEARRLLDIDLHRKHSHHPAHGHNVTVIVGGESKGRQIDGIQNLKHVEYNPKNKFKRKSEADSITGGIEVVVATPGRLEDLLNTVEPVRKRLQDVQVVIFDEADQLLDMGFQSTIQSILQHIPTPQNRHTFMFSATLSSPSIRALASTQLVNKPVHEIDTTNDATTPAGTQTTDLHAHIPQTYALAEYKHWPYLLTKLIKTHVETLPQKTTTTTTSTTTPPQPRIILFCNTSKQAAYFSKLLTRLPSFRSASESGRLKPLPTHINIYELHARLEQSRRARVSDAFRANTTSPSVLVTTDVSARGVDYPDVSLVVQVGPPSSFEQYVHRVGRTGRAGKSGEGVLLVDPYEKGFMRGMDDGVVGSEVIDSWVESEDPKDLALRESVEKAGRDVVAEVEGVEDSYFALLGFYTQQKFVNKAGVGLAAQRYARDLLLLNETPSLSLRLAQQMGLTNVKGIHVRGGGSFSDSEDSPKPRKFSARGDKGGFKGKYESDDRAGNKSSKGNARPWEKRGGR
ncbi:DEAD-domain-containing protein [Rhizoclosmatium globosum]|uniref:ATP-dependent RNA helicase n=1 Tax=Rhizoclosmatium globosum TaxID=329046 RepID=A0A1Y2CMS7_9FUNG|nr:DEAD-domain-containing protein [Rhizoclosmatium globosum]|eukprot:ORY48329.1 DEAD-domain-containing protein [Rhizoclosmatium globosum]